MRRKRSCSSLAWQPVWLSGKEMFFFDDHDDFVPRSKKRGNHDKKQENSVTQFLKKPDLTQSDARIVHVSTLIIPRNMSHLFYRDSNLQTMQSDSKSRNASPGLSTSREHFRINWRHRPFHRPPKESAFK